ncbi:metal ABC transporter substrate-binding protein [Algisphaera agarilytica]|uniref:metal ABC transporter substrate-binding protein n=1 Tax=Algisphaera agarilytica TaxID=1385975 RepID=UPI001C883564|nr:metal ABC transporter substrate-binding protein [Algisphaera agarilytica]
MINQNKRIGYSQFFAGLVVLLMGLIQVGCGDGEEPSATGGSGAEAKPSVVTTTTMLDDLARTLAGDHVEVVGIMRPGQDPHVYEVLPRDAQAIASADLVIANGLNLEATLHGVIEGNAKGKVVYAAEHDAIETLGSEDYEGAPDPHCWMDIELWKHYVTSVRDGLIAIDPGNQADYESRATAYFTELDELQTWMTERFAEVPESQRVIVTSHDAFNYFGNANKIEVHGVIGISTEQAPRPQDIAALEAMVKERNVQALFIESSTSPTLNSIVEKVAEQTGAKVGGTLYSDSLGMPGSGADTYITMMKHNVNTVVDALK